MGDHEVVAFLTHLAVQRKVAAATQAIALNALVFLYNKALEIPLNQISDFKHSSRQRKLPAVLTREEVPFSKHCHSLFKGFLLPSWHVK